MILYPSPIQATAILLAVGFPAILFCCSRIGGTGRRFRIAAAAAATLFAAACFARSCTFEDALSGALLLAGALIFWWIFWSVLVWGFTLTMLTSLARYKQPATLREWMSLYSRRDDTHAFAHNRMQLLLGSHLVTAVDGKIILTPTGILIARLVNFLRSFFGIGPHSSSKGQEP
jgi:hypothetical protein